MGDPMRFVAATAALLVATALSGCVEEGRLASSTGASTDPTEEPAHDASPGADTREPAPSPGPATHQNPGPFRLTILVLGAADPEPAPLPGATVRLTGFEETSIMLEGLTDAAGRITFVPPRDRELHVVAFKEDWTRERTAGIRIGDSSETSRFYMLPIESDPQSATISMFVFAATVSKQFDVNVESQVQVPEEVPGQDGTWVSRVQGVTSNPTLDELYKHRLRRVGTTLTWTTTPVQPSDLELGIGCQATEPQMRTSELFDPTASGTTSRSLEWRLDPQEDPANPVNPCPAFRAGPIQSSINQATTTKVTVVFEFVARG